MTRAISFRTPFTSLFIGIYLATGILPAYSAGNERPGSSGLSIADDLTVKGTGTEYVVGQFPGAVLMKINVWGGVRMPGIYHVPIGTDLLTMISFAGGPSQAAELENIRIKRIEDLKPIALHVDVEDIINGKSAENPMLRVNDVVVVAETKPAVSNNTMLILAVVSTVATLALSAAIYSNSRK